MLIQIHAEMNAVLKVQDLENYQCNNFRFYHHNLLLLCDLYIQFL